MYLLGKRFLLHYTRMKRTLCSYIVDWFQCIGLSLLQNPG